MEEGEDIGGGGGPEEEEEDVWPYFCCREVLEAEVRNLKKKEN